MAIHKIPLEVIVMTDENATVASVIDSNGTVLATGSAKRAPGDPRNERVGLQLAAGRALIKYGEDVELNAL